MKNKSNIFQKGIEIAKSLPKQKYNLVAIITDKKDKILSIGWNSYTRTHPTQAYYAEKVGQGKCIFIHAEISAIINLKRTDVPYAIYIIRINKEDEPVLAKPCRICQNAIKDVGIKEVIYTEE